MKDRRSLVSLSVAAILALALVSGLVLRMRGGEEARAAEASGERPEVSAGSAFATDVPIAVEGVEVVRDTLVIAVRAAGQAVPWRATTVLAQVPGRVARVQVRESQAVRGLTLLVQLDPEEYRLAVEDAEANLRRAETEYSSLTLFDERIADEAVRRQRERAARARSGLDQAEVALRRARMDLERTRLAAPFAGRVSDLRVVPGQWVRAGDPLLTIADIDPIKVEAQVLETEVGFLAAGGSARVTFAAFPAETFTGTIRSINPQVEGDTRVVRVTLEVPNPGGRILPGMYAQVSLDARRFPDRVLVPRAAVLERDRRHMVFVYDGDESGGLAKWRYVTPGLENAFHVEIVEDPENEGVRPGEIVLTGGHYTLIHDARVRLVTDAPAEGGRPR